MKSNREIRDEAWELMWKGRWFWRFLTAAILLVAIVGAVTTALSVAYRSMDIATLRDYAVAQQKAVSQGLTYSASTSESLLRMCGASLFESFVQYLLSGIAMFGLSAIALKAVRRTSEGWLGAAFGGFGMPFATFWLMFGVQIRTAFWMLLILMPVGVLVGLLAMTPVAPLAGGIVAAALSVMMLWLVYRYLLVWYLKADNPEWSAAKCIGGSVGMMNGRKMTALRLDCSYWAIFLWTIPLMAAAGWLAYQGYLNGWVFSLAEQAAIGGLAVVGGIYLAVLFCYLALGHAVFYRELGQQPA